MQELHQLGPGDYLASFRIEAPIGRGGMGLVFRAWQARPGRMVALKVIAPELASDQGFQARFEQESSNAAQIEHPNVIPVYEVGEDRGVLFIAMRFVDGLHLGEFWRSRGRLQPAHAVRLIGQIASALDAAHARGLVHRDVKPGNVLVSGTTPNEHLYLTDFGLTKRNDASEGLTRTGMYVGTLDYIAPEQVTGARVDARTDVYSLGCVLYELLTGRVPFPRENDAAKIFAHVSVEAPAPSELAPDVPIALDRAVACAMAKDPSERYESAGDFASAALAAATGQIPTAPEGSVATGAAAIAEVEHELEAAPREEPSVAAVDETIQSDRQSNEPVKQTVTKDAAGPTEPAEEPDSVHNLASVAIKPGIARRQVKGSAHRRRVVALGGATAVLAGVLLGLNVLGGSGRAIGVHNHLVSITFSPPWHRAPSAPKSDLELMTSPLALHDGAISLSVGELRRSNVIPGNAPPKLVESMGTPASESTVRLAHYTARRYVWMRPRQPQTLVFVLASRAGDVALVCRGPVTSTAACTKLADAVSVFARVEPPGPDASVARALATDLMPVLRARAAAGSSSHPSLPARAAGLRNIAAVEAGAAQKLAVVSAPLRNLSAVRAVVSSLENNGATWRSLAAAAQRSQRERYMNARGEVLRTGRALAAAVAALHAQGFVSPLLGVITPAPAPTPGLSAGHQANGGTTPAPQSGAGSPGEAGTRGAGTQPATAGGGSHNKASRKSGGGEKEEALESSATSR